MIDRLACLPLSFTCSHVNVCMHHQTKTYTTSTHVRHQSHRSSKPSYIYGVASKRFISKPLSSTNDWNLASSRHTLSCSNMCSGSWNSKKHSSPPVVIRPQQQKKKKKPHISMTLRRKRLRVIRRREMWRAGAELEMLNLKLYLENRCILVENERLRERAGVLRRENLALRANLCKTAAAGAELAAGC